MGGMQTPDAEILEAEGTQHLVVTHKSILRALLCVALNLPSTSFRAFDIHNAGVCTFRCVIASCPVSTAAWQTLRAEGISGPNAIAHLPNLQCLQLLEGEGNVRCCLDIQDMMESSALT